MPERRTIVLERFPGPGPGLWLACPSDAEHCGGVGGTPEEAIGWMVFNHPQRCGVGSFDWASPPPKLPNPKVNQYPTGEQEEFEHIP